MNLRIIYMYIVCAYCLLETTKKVGDYHQCLWVRDPKIRSFWPSVVHTNRMRLYLVKQSRNLILWSKNGEGLTSTLQILSLWFEEVRRVLKDWWKVGRFRSGGFQEKGRVLWVVMEHAQFLNLEHVLLGTCLAIHCMTHFSVKSPPLAIIFSMQMGESSSKGHLGRGLGHHCGSSSAKWFLSCGPWVSYLILAGRISSLWNFCHFLTSSSSFVRGCSGEWEKTRKLIDV